MAGAAGRLHGVSLFRADIEMIVSLLPLKQKVLIVTFCALDLLGIHLETRGSYAVLRSMEFAFSHVQCVFKMFSQNNISIGSASNLLFFPQLKNIQFTVRGE